jgi:hypothetical protein
MYEGTAVNLSMIYALCRHLLHQADKRCQRETTAIQILNRNRNRNTN